MNASIFLRIARTGRRAVIAIAASIAALSCSQLPQEPVPPMKLTGIDPLISIHLVNYLGNRQNIHPKVLYFSKSFAGYHYWMAYTPYPNGSINDENPCIAVSNDGIEWHEPGMSPNPLAVAPPGGYNSDTHLVYNPQRRELECWYRQFHIDTKAVTLLRRTTFNGVDWSRPDTILGPSNRSVYLSPAVDIRDGRYEMLYSDGWKLMYTRARSAAPAVDWEEPAVVVNDPILGIWHQDFIYDTAAKRPTAIVIANGFTRGGNGNSADLYSFYLDLSTLQHNQPRMLIPRDPSPGSISERSVYRSSIVKVGNTYRVYYSCIDNKWIRYMNMETFTRSQLGDWTTEEKK